MDLIGDIVEHDIPPPTPPSFPAPGTASGFPKIDKKRPSQWKARLQKNGILSKPIAPPNDLYNIDDEGKKRLKSKKLNYEGLSESEKIHQENIELLSRMTVDERESEKQELIDSLDPNILQALLMRGEKKSKIAAKDESFEGFNEWIGGGKNGLEWGAGLDKDDVDKALGIQSTSLSKDIESGSKDETLKSQTEENNDKVKKVRFDNLAKVMYDPEESLKPENKANDDGWEDVEEIEDISPNSSQNQVTEGETIDEILTTNVHFPKSPKVEEEELDLYDPDFQNKLHEKYFPDLPKDTEKLKWMENMPEINKNLSYESISDLRFDFKGNLIAMNTDDVPVHMGLHHHSLEPQLPGYTFGELAHLSRSSLPSQRSIAIQTIGRILHKLGKKKYHIVAADAEVETEESVSEFEQMLWGLIDEMRVIETLQEAADEKYTKNLSVRSYAIEALWLWKQGGGNKRNAK